jgi:uncharacterized PurR-regulated membrane protein YhhQ (DUF165 family)
MIPVNQGSKTALGAAAFVAYIVAIFLANWLLVRFGLVPVGFGLYAPAGVFVAGVSFILRDVIQEELGIGWVILGIILGAMASVAVSASFALASGAAFLFSEFADFAVYTPLRRRSWTVAAVASNTVGDVVDSCVFLWLAFGSLQNVLGLMVGKYYVTLPIIAYGGYRRWRKAFAYGRPHACDR